MVPPPARTAARVWGLTITSHLVALMEGRLWVESEPGKGSMFHFTARLGVAQSGSEPRRLPRDLHGRAGPGGGR